MARSEDAMRTSVIERRGFSLRDCHVTMTLSLLESLQNLRSQAPVVKTICNAYNYPHIHS